MCAKLLKKKSGQMHFRIARIKRSIFPIHHYLAVSGVKNRKINKRFLPVLKDVWAQKSTFV